MSEDRSTHRLGVDIGGTFTDAMLLDDRSGAVHVAKVPSTPGDPSIGFLAAIRQILADADVEPGDVSYLVHGTTVATNAIIEGKGARTGFITTEGFRDLLEIQRQMRPALYDVKFEKPQPLVPRYLACEIPGRMNGGGEETTPLDGEAVRRAAHRLGHEGVESVAVCYLHAYANPDHELRTALILDQELPGVEVSLSSTIAPEIREYFRASTTVVNAFVQPVVKRYLHALEDRLREEGFTSPLLLMQSNGGVRSFAGAAERPVYMVESGPAAGVMAAKYIGQQLSRPNVISFDMGGTTAKVGMIRDGRPDVAKDYEVGTQAGADVGRNRGSGYPIKTPVIDLVEIGAGGGSIAWVDAGGALRVGRDSAGADPGPACYGRGGVLPTVTDANLVLGRLDPENFLGGRMRLDAEASARAIEENCAKPLGMSVVDCAHGIIEIANVAMINGLRLVSVQRGYDPRGFALVAFGGGGPAHANRLATALEMPLTIIPRAPGITSAMGALVTDLMHEYSQAHMRRTDRIDIAELEAAYRGLERQAREALDADGAARVSIQRQVEMRYVGQSFELTIDVPRELGLNALAEVIARFHSEHERAYGYASLGEPTEFVSLRLTGTGHISKPGMQRAQPAGSGGVGAAQAGVRKVFFPQVGFVDCPIYERSALGRGASCEGPAIVVEMDSTTVVEPGTAMTVDEYGNLLLNQRFDGSRDAARSVAPPRPVPS